MTVPDGQLTDAQAARGSGHTPANGAQQEYKRVFEWMQKVREVNAANPDGDPAVQDLQPLVSFGYARGFPNGGPGYENSGPNLSDYRRAVEAFMAKYGDVVRYYTPRNEPNLFA